jgi:6-phosphogluconate dehydrogenase
MKSRQAEIGVIGLAVMGQNLVLNMCDHDFVVAVFNRTYARTQEFLDGLGDHPPLIGCATIEDFFSALQRPRKVLLMVKAGKPIDDLLEESLPFLEAGDILIDGGNSHYRDTARRTKLLQAKGIHYIGMGISGGEEGARHGPSMMPGGSYDAWPHVKEIFRSIAARADDGEPCCDWIGEGGAGHYVKMVHNGIEYGEMQIICEAYDILKRVAGCSLERLQKIFEEWNHGPLSSYLIEITAQIFAFQSEDGSPLLDKILDVAGQKGTGKWTGIEALDQESPVTLIVEAVLARSLSGLKREREAAAERFALNIQRRPVEEEKFIEQIGKALYAAKIISYTQGFMLMRSAASAMDWELNYSVIAMIWRAGCIIRSQLLDRISQAFAHNPALPSLLFDDFFAQEICDTESALREVVATACLAGVPVPCFSAALAFFDGIRSNPLPTNLIQAQRDFFGAHTYERIDQPRGQFFHTNWTGTGGKVSSTTYNA